MVPPLSALFILISTVLVSYWYTGTCQNHEGSIMGGPIVQSHGNIKPSSLFPMLQQYDAWGDCFVIGHEGDDDELRQCLNLSFMFYLSNLSGLTRDLLGHPL